MIVDTSVLLAYFDLAEPANARCTEVIESCTEGLVASPYVLAELDYLLATRLGVGAEIAVLDEMVSGAWELAAFAAEDLRAATTLITRYADQHIGLADASNVVLADRYRTRTIATLDHRHFDVLRPIGGGRFTVVP